MCVNLSHPADRANNKSPLVAGDVSTKSVLDVGIQLAPSRVLACVNSWDEPADDEDDDDDYDDDGTYDHLELPTRAIRSAN